MRTSLSLFAMLLVATSSPAAAQANSRSPGAQRAARMGCTSSDSTRTFRRAVGDTTGARITGGTARSREFPEYDVVLDVPNLCVERITLKVDSVTAQLQLNARVANLVRVEAGANALIGNVDLTVQGIRAQALLLVDLDDVVHVVDNTLTFIDNHPEVVSQLTSTLQNTVGSVGGLVHDLVLGVTKNNLGQTVQRIVDQATGSILERTLSAAGQQIAQRTVGSIANLPLVKETAGAANTVIRQVRDQAGSLIEYTLDKATNRISGIKLLR